MELDLRGHPLHTRALSITLAARADGAVDVAGSLLDLRKRGFVPVGGDLQSSGIIHHMLVDLTLDAAGTTVLAAQARQPTVAFEATEATGGESCRDPVATIGALVGSTIGARWPEHVGEALGGPRACFHVFTLAHLLGATAAWALASAPALPAGRRHAAGARTFRRDLVIDGAQLPDRRLALAAQLIDLHFAPTAGLVPSMERLAACREARLQATFGPPDFLVEEGRAAERRRDAATLETPWRERPDVAAHLVGLPLLRGATAALLGRFGDPGEDRPLLDAALMLAPTLIQVFAAVADWGPRAQREHWLLGMGGQVDSCWMWRRDGGLDRLRSRQDPAAS